MTKRFLLALLSITLSSTITDRLCAQEDLLPLPEMVNLMPLPEDSWTNTVQASYSLITPGRTKDEQHDHKLGVVQNSINYRIAKGGNEESPRAALYASYNQYKLIGSLGEKIDANPLYLPLIATTGFIDTSSSFRMNYLFAMQFNQTDWDLTSSTRYFGMLMAQSPLCSNFTLNYGALAISGLHKTSIYPVVGFEYVSGRFSFKATYPLEVKATFRMTPQAAFYIGTRWNNDRLRLHDDAQKKHGIIQYNSYGLHIGTDLKFCNYWQLTLQLGHNSFGGANAELSNHIGRHRKRWDLKGSPYGQIALSFSI